MITISSLRSLYLSQILGQEFQTQLSVFSDSPVPFIVDVTIEPLDQTNKLRLFIPKWINYEKIINELTISEQGVPIVPNFEMTSHYLLVTGITKGIEALKAHIGNEEFPLDPFICETNVHQGKNAAIVISNQYDERNIEDWLNYHHKVHNLEFAVVVERRHPDESALDISKIGTNLETILMPTTLPFGINSPSEKTIWMCPTAPGKEKMTAPANDRWHSELDGNLLLEIIRARYLAKAGAVLHLQVSDLLPPTAVSIFDEVKANPDGYFALMGHRCFPWRIRNNEIARHSDHICIKFDDNERNKSWIIASHSQRNEAPWNLYRIGALVKDDGKTREFWRMMALRHQDPDDVNATIAPKTSLIKNEELIRLARDHFQAKPILPPETASPEIIKAQKSGRRLIVTTMKNEGPFLLEWIAYHRAIGFDDFIVFTNDCDDGTDKFFDLLHSKGIAEHRQNPYREVNLKPQHAALFDAPKSKLFQNADWKICMDVDEYINIKIGDGRLDDLFEAVGDANMISLTWRLIGNSGVDAFVDAPIISQFNQAAHQITRFPHQAWGVKTLYRDLGFYKKMGVHRPKGLIPEKMHNIHWVNGSGKPLPETFYRSAWRTGTATVGYDLVELNHYAVRSMESFLVKRDRGRVNHVDRDQGLHYWFRMNHNVVEESTIMKRIPMMQLELDKLMADPEIRKMHETCVASHAMKIEGLLKTESYQNFYNEIRSERMQTLSKYTNVFGANIFDLGPDVIKDEDLQKLITGQLQYLNTTPEGSPHNQ